MEPSNGHPQCLPDEADNRSAWGWMALALATGFLATRHRSRAGAYLGLGFAALHCWQSARRSKRNARQVASASIRPATAPVALVQPADSMVESLANEPEPGKWWQQVEPLPSVVEDDWSGGETAGQADLLLNQPPLFPEELPLPSTSVLWLNEGAGIPDSVEIPELFGESPPAREQDRLGK